MRLSIALSFLVAAPGFIEPAEVVEKSFAVSGVPLVHVRNEDGRTELSSHAESRVDVRATKEVVGSVSDEDARRLAEEVEVRLSQIGDQIEVETIYPKKHRLFWRAGRVLVHLDIRTPRRSDLDVSTEDGPTTVRGIEGNLVLKTEDGDLSVIDGAGSIRARTEDGDLLIEASPSLLVAETEDGDLTLRLRPGAVMDGGWSVRSEDGSVELVLPEDFAVDLDVRVDDGRIRADLPGATTTELSRRRMEAKLNGGGHRMQIRTEDGSVRLKTAP